MSTEIDIELTRRFVIDAGHRLQNHGGKCRHYHGHRYVIEATISGLVGDGGMVLDFGEIKARLGDWLDTFLDHSFMVQAGDPMIHMHYPGGPPVSSTIYVVDASRYVKRLPKEVDFSDLFSYYWENRLVVMPVPPTAENIAGIVFRAFSTLLSVAYSPEKFPKLVLEAVHVQETENCSAEARLTR